ncbi:hypothetical protein AMS68_004663 [Peltaster fructicola]|uniref:Chromo domain-containing protein n=1 Tax=Peltaster fructicola TaxID=286661 RepID=A0A6H0XWT6_9PEZI|nr:hypothetical protein AMS68_004663 [Peltaster fructicola]
MMDIDPVAEGESFFDLPKAWADNLSNDMVDLDPLQASLGLANIQSSSATNDPKHSMVGDIAGPSHEDPPLAFVNPADLINSSSAVNDTNHRMLRPSSLSYSTTLMSMGDKEHDAGQNEEKKHDNEAGQVMAVNTDAQDDGDDGDDGDQDMPVGTAVNQANVNVDHHHGQFAPLSAYKLDGQAQKMEGSKENHWLVWQVMDCKFSQGAWMYLVDWVGDWEPSWEPLKNLVPEAVDVVLAFHRQNRTADGPKRLNVYKDYTAQQQLYGIQQVEARKASGYFPTHNAPKVPDPSLPMKGFFTYSWIQQLYAMSQVQLGIAEGRFGTRTENPFRASSGQKN